MAAWLRPSRLAHERRFGRPGAYMHGRRVEAADIRHEVLLDVVREAVALDHPVHD